MPAGATFNDPDEAPFLREDSALTRQALQAGRLKGIAQAEGIVMIVLGILALLFPYVASAGVTVMVAVELSPAVSTIVYVNVSLKVWLVRRKA